MRHKIVKAHSKRELSSILTITVLIAIIIVFSIGQSVQMYFEFAQKNLRLEERMLVLTEIITSSFSEAIWDYNEDQIQIIGNSIFIDEEIESLYVTDNTVGVVFDREKDRGIDPKRLQSISAVINKGDKSIGTLTLVYSKRLLVRSLVNDILKEIMIIMSILLVLIIVLTLVIKRYLQPLIELEFFTTNLLDDLDSSFDVHSNCKEIDGLIVSFKYMQRKVGEYTKELQLINESLEDKVTERTDQLSVKNRELQVLVRQLESAQEELIKASKVKLTSKLVSGVAHEINTPLGNAFTLTSFIEQIIIDARSEKKEGSEFIIMDDYDFDMMDQSVQKLMGSLGIAIQLVDQFKALRVTLDSTVEKEIEVWQVLKNCINLAELSYNRRFEVELICDKDLVVTTHETVLTEIFKLVFNNIVTHAYQSDETIKVSIGCRLHDEEIEIAITDYGKGISPTYLDNIFVAFSKESRASAGSGLGLAIVENLVVNGLDGKIDCISKVGEGTTLTIRFK